MTLGPVPAKQTNENKPVPRVEVASSDLSKSISVNKIPALNVEHLQRMITEEDSSNTDGEFEKCDEMDNDCVLFDSCRKCETEYESEHEQELKVRPEMPIFQNNFSETDSEYGLKLELKECEYASNSSSAMTPRIEKESERFRENGEVSINPEIDFTQSYNKVKLSPEQISRVKELTSMRKLEHMNRNMAEDLFSSKTQCWQQMREEDERIMTYTIDKYSSYAEDIVESDRESRKRQIIERLESLL